MRHAYSIMLLYRNVSFETWVHMVSRFAVQCSLISILLSLDSSLSLGVEPWIIFQRILIESFVSYSTYFVSHFSAWTVSSPKTLNQSARFFFKYISMPCCVTIQLQKCFIKSDFQCEKLLFVENYKIRKKKIDFR